MKKADSRGKTIYFMNRNRKYFKWFVEILNVIVAFSKIKDLDIQLFLSQDDKTITTRDTKNILSHYKLL